MLIDRKARPWIFLCFVIFAAATYFFVGYWRQSHGEVTGGSWPGLAFGAGGSAAMLVAMLLAVRKNTRTTRLGRPYHWMQAHVWFGLLSYPLILYHARFAWGGWLTYILMWVFTVVYVSGIVGLILQQIIPARLMREVPAETIAAQIYHVLRELRDEAEAIVQPWRAGRERDLLAAGAGGRRRAAAVMLPKATSELDAFDLFYSGKIVPFLGDRYQRRSPLASALWAQEAFSQWRARMPESLHPAISKLESLVDERRQLAHQRRLNAWLHRWLLIHVPLSYALIARRVIHAVAAFKFTSPGR